MKNALRNTLLIGAIALLGGCAGARTRPDAYAASQGYWRGFVLRAGLREPIVLDLEKVSGGWVGSINAGDNDVSLENVSITGTSVHFELPGEGVFDGAIASDSMAGSISGPLSGSFSLTRLEPRDPSVPTVYYLGP